MKVNHEDMSWLTIKNESTYLKTLNRMVIKFFTCKSLITCY